MSTTGARDADSLQVLDADRCRGDDVCVEVCSKMVLEIADGRRGMG